MTPLSRTEMLRSFEKQMADYARGEKLRDLREGKRMSQEDAAHEIGVTSKTLRTWEKGGPIKWENAKAAAAFYEVNPEELVSREELPDVLESTAGVPTPYKTADVARAIAMDAKLTAICDHFGIEWLEPDAALPTESLREAEAAASRVAPKKSGPRRKRAHS